MLKTCLNCSYFVPILEKPNSFYHIHNYCSLWDKTFANLQKSFITSFLDGNYSELEKLKEVNPELNICICDDIECGLANCYMFTPNPTCEDKKIKDRFEHNKKLALTLIDYILEKGYICLGDNSEWRLSEDEIDYYKKYKERLQELALEVDRLNYRLGD